MARFYLRKWARGGEEVHEYRRRPYHGGILSRTVSVGSTAFRKRLYSLLPSALEPSRDALEQELGRLETRAATVLDALLTRGAASLTAEERVVWARYLYLQLDRDPARLRHLIEIVREWQRGVHADMNRVTGHSAELDSDMQSMAFNVALWSLISPDPLRDEWERTLSTYAWRTAHCPGAFITSDRPILLDFGKGGPGTTSALLTMALSPDCLLFCYPSSWPPGSDLALVRDGVPMFNGRLIECRPRFVYSACPLDQLPGIKLRPFLERFLPSIDDLVDDGQ